MVEALRSHDAGPALAWCEEHRSRLRKARSGLELQLRVQVGLSLPAGGEAKSPLRDCRGSGCLVRGGQQRSCEAG